MKEATKFSRFLDKNLSSMPEEIQSLAKTAQCAHNQMAHDPRSNENEPRLKVLNVEAIKAFEDAYAAMKSAS